MSIHTLPPYLPLSIHNRRFREDITKPKVKKEPKKEKESELAKEAKEFWDKNYKEAYK